MISTGGRWSVTPFDLDRYLDYQSQIRAGIITHARVAADCLKGRSHVAYFDMTGTGEAHCVCVINRVCVTCDHIEKALRVGRGALSLCEPDAHGLLCLYEEPEAPCP